MLLSVRSRWVLLVIGSLGLLGCSSLPFTGPTVTRQPPTACVTPCTKLTPPASNRADAVRSWTFDLVGAYGECRRTHAQCVDWHLKTLPKKP